MGVESLDIITFGLEMQSHKKAKYIIHSMTLSKEELVESNRAVITPKGSNCTYPVSHQCQKSKSNFLNQIFV